MSRPTPLSKANTTFSLALLKKLSDEEKTGNVFFSPSSISSAMAMVMLGTRGNTATQMSEVLCFTEPPRPVEEPQSLTQSYMQTRIQTQRMQQSSNLPEYLRKCLTPQMGQDDVHASFAQLLGELNKEDAQYALSVANRLYGEKTYKFHEHFIADTKKYYSADLDSVDFKTNADEARVNINDWVEEQTQGKIKDLLRQGVVGDLTKLVLVNAIYFKGIWNKQFEEESTVDAEFRINKNESKPVKMMCQKTKLPLASVAEAQCQILEMPYKGKDLSMLVFLPNEIEDDTTGLEKLEKELTYEKFVEWTRPAPVGKSEIQVNLPRFKMEEKYSLKDVLTSMGMEDAFDGTKSNYTGMSDANDLVLSDVVHKAFLEVNEEGAEAAAATGAVANTRSLLKPIIFNADHPFLFFIRHNITMSILFAGKYCSPE